MGTRTCRVQQRPLSMKIVAGPHSEGSSSSWHCSRFSWHISNVNIKRPCRQSVKASSSFVQVSFFRGEECTNGECVRVQSQTWSWNVLAIFNLKITCASGSHHQSEVHADDEKSSSGVFKHPVLTFSPLCRSRIQNIWKFSVEPGDFGPAWGFRSRSTTHWPSDDSESESGTDKWGLWL